jgi:hypothetical protein
VAIACGSSHGATGRGTFVRSTRVQVVLRGGVLVGAHPIGNERANRQGIAPSPRRRRRPVCLSTRSVAWRHHTHYQMDIDSPFQHFLTVKN